MNKGQTLDASLPRVHFLSLVLTNCEITSAATDTKEKRKLNGNWCDGKTSFV